MNNIIYESIPSKFGHTVYARVIGNDKRFIAGNKSKNKK
jgi:hypothetical protein